MNRLTLIAILLAFTLPGLAQAAAPQGLYVSGQAGFSTPSDEDLEFGGGNKLEPDWNGAAFVSMAIGRSWEHFRTELELGYRNNSTDNINFKLAGSAPLKGTSSRLISDGGSGVFPTRSGSATLWTLMANVIHDWSPESIVRPYVGVGVGAANFSFGGIKATKSPGIFTELDSHDTTFAYQGIVGVSLHVSDKIVWELRGTALSLLDPSFSTSEGESFDMDHFSTAIGLILRWYL